MDVSSEWGGGLERNFGVLLASHGSLAQGALEALELLMGHQEGFETVALFPGMGPPELRAEMEEKLKALAGFGNVLIVADLAGGTPANVASALVAERPELQLVAGANMALLCEIAAGTSLDGLNEWLELGHEGIRDLGAKVRALKERELQTPPAGEDL